MRVRLIPSSELSVKSLLASDYVANPRKLATTAVKMWSKEHGNILNLNSPAGQRLIQRVEAAVREGMGKR